MNSSDMADLANSAASSKRNEPPPLARFSPANPAWTGLFEHCQVVSGAGCLVEADRPDTNNNKLTSLASTPEISTLA